MKILHPEITEKRKTVILKSVLWNTLVSIFLEETSQDITPYIVSIRKQSDIFIIKLSKPIIKASLEIYAEKIKIVFAQKAEKMWISCKEIEIFYK